MSAVQRNEILLEDMPYTQAVAEHGEGLWIMPNP